MEWDDFAEKYRTMEELGQLRARYGSPSCIAGKDGAGAPGHSIYVLGRMTEAESQTGQHDDNANLAAAE